MREAPNIYSPPLLMVHIQSNYLTTKYLNLSFKHITSGKNSKLILWVLQLVYDFWDPPPFCTGPQIFSAKL